MLFSQAPCGLFLPHSDFYLRLRKGRLMALFYRLPFPYDSRPPKITGFAYADKIHVFRPFRLAALVCRSARCGCLTPYLSVPKRTDEFLIFQASKIGFPQKRLLFSRCCGFCCLFLTYWLFLFLLFTDLLRLCRFWKSVYFLFLFSPSVCRGCFPFGFNSTLKQIFQSAKFFFVRLRKTALKWEWTPAREGCFYSIENQSITEKKIFFQKNIGFNA